MGNDSLKTTKRLWDSSTYTADWRDVLSLLNGKIFETVKEMNLPPDATILEIGTGSCKWSAAFSIMGYHVTAMDNNPEMLVQGQRNFPNIKMEFVVDELPDLKSPESKRKYDLVFNEGVIEHFLDDGERLMVLKAMKNCCIAGGWVYFIVPFLSIEPDEHRYTSIREMELELQKAGFTKYKAEPLIIQTPTAQRLNLMVVARNI